jgi:hypothetical protein
MVVRVTKSSKVGTITIAAEAAPALLLCTALAAPGQRQPFDVSYGHGGEFSMITVSTAELKAPEYVIDERTKNWVKFHFLANQWRSERGAHATAAELAALPSYQKIMGMGRDALPFILDELKSEGNAPDHWFWALAVIADENPVPPESRGKLSEMAKAWIEWGQKEGYVD